MILVVGEAFINLRTAQIRKASGHERLQGLAVLEKADHVMHPDTRALDDRIAPAYARNTGNVAVPGSARRDDAHGG